jgi:chromosome segregation protein
LPQISGARNAVDVVDAPTGILANLVNVVIVDDIAAARALYAAQPSANKLVVITKEGDVLTESVIRGGSGQKPSKVQLVAERDSAESAVANHSLRKVVRVSSLNKGSSSISRRRASMTCHSGSSFSASCVPDGRDLAQNLASQKIASSDNKSATAKKTDIKYPEKQNSDLPH